MESDRVISGRIGLSSIYRGKKAESFTNDSGRYANTVFITRLAMGDNWLTFREGNRCNKTVYFSGAHIIGGPKLGRLSGLRFVCRDSPVTPLLILYDPSQDREDVCRPARSVWFKLEIRVCKLLDNRISLQNDLQGIVEG